jgi:hypothetical protein
LAIRKTEFCRPLNSHFIMSVWDERRTSKSHFNYSWNKRV